MKQTDQNTGIFDKGDGYFKSPTEDWETGPTVIGVNAFTLEDAKI